MGLGTRRFVVNGFSTRCFDSALGPDLFQARPCPFCAGMGHADRPADAFGGGSLASEPGLWRWRS